MVRISTPQIVALAVLVGAGTLAAWAITARPEPVARPAPPTVAAVEPAAPRAAAVPKPGPSPKPSLTPEPYVIKRVMTLPGPLTHGRHYWDEAGVPDGPLLITVDLSAQVLSVFRGGYEIGTAVILYGAGDKPTPLGVFQVTEKDADHISNLYGAPMPYMLRLTNDGISIHGSTVLRDTATHGCVGVPNAFAKKLFAQVKLGDRVVVTDGERLELGQAVKAGQGLSR